MSVILTPIRKTFTSILGGSIDFSIKIPGTYAGLNPKDYTGAGRFFQRAEMISDSFVPGDLVTNLKLTDTDGVVTTPERAALPNYPDVVRFYDSSDTDNANGCFFNSLTPLEFEPFDASGQPSPKFLPAQLYLTGTFTTGGLAIGHVVRINIFWGRWVADP